MPFPSAPTETCTRGFYGNWVVLAKTRAHVKATIDFARRNNVRLVIRNTGHDFMGRSTGFGSLILNTHSFKEVEFTKRYTGPGSWRGGAVRVGAGIQGRELWRLANAQSPPQAVVTGECPVSLEFRLLIVSKSDIDFWTREDRGLCRRVYPGWWTRAFVDHVWHG